MYVCMYVCMYIYKVCPISSDNFFPSMIAKHGDESDATI
jgi:hypothetical protein